MGQTKERPRVLDEALLYRTTTVQLLVCIISDHQHNLLLPWAISPEGCIIADWCVTGVHRFCLKSRSFCIFHDCASLDSLIEHGCLLETMGIFCSPHWHWKRSYGDSSTVIRIIFVVIVSLCLAIPFHRLIKKLVYLTCLSIFHRLHQAPSLLLSLVRALQRTVATLHRLREFVWRYRPAAGRKPKR